MHNFEYFALIILANTPMYSSNIICFIGTEFTQETRFTIAENAKPLTFLFWFALNVGILPFFYEFH